MRALPALLTATVLLSGCTSGSSAPQDAAATSSGRTSTGGPSDAGTATATSTATPTATSTGSATPTGEQQAAVPPPPPPPAACYRLTSPELTRPTSSTRRTSCSARHTARTIHVGRLATTVRGRAVEVDSPAVQRQLARVCPRRLAAYVGGTRDRRVLSRLAVVWFSPTLEQADAGARWFRCDLVAFDRGPALLALPPAGRLRGVLDRPAALDTYGLCGTAAPGAKAFQRVACARRHSWRAVDTVPLRGRVYPGVRKVRRAGDAACKAEARARAEDTLQFRYGWEWPTADQWAAGQRFGYCWVPEQARD